MSPQPFRDGVLTRGEPHLRELDQRSACSAGSSSHHAQSATTMIRAEQLAVIAASTGSNEDLEIFHVPACIADCSSCTFAAFCTCDSERLLLHSVN